MNSTCTTETTGTPEHAKPQNKMSSVIEFVELWFRSATNISFLLLLCSFLPLLFQKKEEEELNYKIYTYDCEFCVSETLLWTHHKNAKQKTNERRRKKINKIEQREFWPIETADWQNSSSESTILKKNSFIQTHWNVVVHTFYISLDDTHLILCD